MRGRETGRYRHPEMRWRETRVTTIITVFEGRAIIMVSMTRNVALAYAQGAVI